MFKKQKNQKKMATFMRCWRIISSAVVASTVAVVVLLLCTSADTLSVNGGAGNVEQKSGFQGTPATLPRAPLRWDVIEHGLFGPMSFLEFMNQYYEAPMALSIQRNEHHDSFGTQRTDVPCREKFVVSDSALSPVVTISNTSKQCAGEHPPRRDSAQDEYGSDNMERGLLNNGEKTLEELFTLDDVADILSYSSGRWLLESIANVINRPGVSTTTTKNGSEKDDDDENNFYSGHRRRVRGGMSAAKFRCSSDEQAYSEIFGGGDVRRGTPTSMNHRHTTTEHGDSGGGGGVGSHLRYPCDLAGLLGSVLSDAGSEADYFGGTRGDQHDKTTTQEGKKGGGKDLKHYLNQLIGSWDNDKDVVMHGPAAREGLRDFQQYLGQLAQMHGQGAQGTPASSGSQDTTATDRDSSVFDSGAVWLNEFVPSTTATVIIRDADGRHPVLRQLAREINARLGVDVGISVYFTPTTSAGDGGTPRKTTMNAFGTGGDGPYHDASDGGKEEDRRTSGSQQHKSFVNAAGEHLPVRLHVKGVEPHVDTMDVVMVQLAGEPSREHKGVRGCSQKTGKDGRAAECGMASSSSRTAAAAASPRSPRGKLWELHPSRIPLLREEQHYQVDPARHFPRCNQKSCDGTEATGVDHGTARASESSSSSLCGAPSVVLLLEGDVLYVPRGMMHNATTAVLLNVPPAQIATTCSPSNMDSCDDGKDGDALDSARDTTSETKSIKHGEQRRLTVSGSLHLSIGFEPKNKLWEMFVHRVLSSVALSSSAAAAVTSHGEGDVPQKASGGRSANAETPHVQGVDGACEEKGPASEECVAARHFERAKRFVHKCVPSMSILTSHLMLRKAASNNKNAHLRRSIPLPVLERFFELGKREKDAAQQEHSSSSSSNYGEALLRHGSCDEKLLNNETIAFMMSPGSSDNDTHVPRAVNEVACQMSRMTKRGAASEQLLLRNNLFSDSNLFDTSHLWFPEVSEYAEGSQQCQLELRLGLGSKRRGEREGASAEEEEKEEEEEEEQPLGVTVGTVVDYIVEYLRNEEGLADFAARVFVGSKSDDEDETSGAAEGCKEFGGLTSSQIEEGAAGGSGRARKQKQKASSTTWRVSPPVYSALVRHWRRTVRESYAGLLHAEASPYEEGSSQAAAAAEGRLCDVLRSWWLKEDGQERVDRVGFDAWASVNTELLALGRRNQKA